MLYSSVLIHRDIVEIIVYEEFELSMGGYQRCNTPKITNQSIRNKMRSIEEIFIIQIDEALRNLDTQLRDECAAEARQKDLRK